MGGRPYRRVCADGREGDEREMDRYSAAAKVSCRFITPIIKSMTHNSMTLNDESTNTLFRLLELNLTTHFLRYSRSTPPLH